MQEMIGQPQKPEVTMPDENQIVKQVTDLLEAAREYRKPIQEDWNENRRAYHNKHDFEGKASWQSKHYLPKVAKDADYIAGKIAEATTDRQDMLIEIVPQQEAAAPAASIIGRLIRENWSREGFDEWFEGQTVHALMTSGYVMKAYPDESGPWPNYTRIQPCPMDRLYRDPAGRNKYLHYITPMDFSDAVRLAESNGWDVEAMQGVRGQGDPTAKQDESSWKRSMAEECGLAESSESTWRNTVFLIEYYGPLYDSNKDEVYPFVYAVVANRKRLVFLDVDPFGDGKPGMVTGDIIYDPFGVYGKPFLSDGREIANAQTKLANVILDQVALNIPALEYDTGNATAESDAAVIKGVPMGSVLPKQGPNALLNPVKLSYFSGETVMVAQWLDNERQAATNSTDMTRGIPAQGSSRDITATEYTGKMAASGGTLKSIATGIERRLIVPLAERCLYYLQRGGIDIYNQAVRAVAGNEIEKAIQDITRQMLESPKVAQEVQAGTPQQVVGAMVRQEAEQALQQYLSQPFTVKARGISAVLERQESLAAAVGYLGILSQLPNGQMVIDTPKAGKMLGRLSGVAFDDVAVDNADQQWMMSMAQMMAQQMAQQFVQQYEQQREMEDQQEEADEAEKTIQQAKKVKSSD